MTRFMVAEDLEHDPTFKRQRAAASRLLALAINHLSPGHTMREALIDAAVANGVIVFDNRDHAYRCPAYHERQRRMPVGPCMCGATK